MKCVMMQPNWPYDGFFINWKQCVTVIWFFVSIETESKEIDSFQGNRTDGMVEISPLSSDIVTFMNYVMPICPPPNHLHLVCDVTFSAKYVTCTERAVVIRHCLDLFEGIYVDSDWLVCESVDNFCEETVYLLKVKGYITTSELPGLRTSERPGLITTETSDGDIITAFSGRPTHITTVVATTETTSNLSTSYHTEVKVITTDSPVTMTTNTSSIETSGKPSHPENEEEALSPTYVYALIGVIVVLIEIVILCFIYFYLKKRRTSQPYRHPSKIIPNLEESIPKRKGWVLVYHNVLGYWDSITSGLPAPGSFACSVTMVIMVGTLGCRYWSEKGHLEKPRFLAPQTEKVSCDSDYDLKTSESIHEEILAPETTSPTQALVVPNTVYDEEDIFKQDQIIYQSYLNLRFIDDSSVEATPEKIIMK